MEKLVKDSKKLEMDIARYIYKKYIAMSLSSTETNDSKSDSQGNSQIEIDIELGLANNEKSEDEVIESDIEEKINDESLEKGNSNKNRNRQEYNKYLKTIFHRDRKIGVINQITELKKDLDDMAKADSAYSRNADKFNPSLYESLPDVLRCTYIRKHNHRYYRCKNKIANDDSDVCKKHLESENIYIDNYNDLIESITNH